eukprot:scaffold2175_cov381-Prasinococcus_capsulatus_cf.AAC.13
MEPFQELIPDRPLLQSSPLERRFRGVRRRTLPVEDTAGWRQSQSEGFCQIVKAFGGRRRLH